MRDEATFDNEELAEKIAAEQDRDEDHDDEKDDGKKSQSTELVDFVLARCEVFHDANNEVFARINATGEIRRLDSRGMKDWLLAGFYETSEKSARDQSVREAIATLGGVARYKGELRDVHLRVAYHDRAYYLDLGEPGQSRAVRITPGAWEVISNPPVPFIRPDSLRPLPEPVSGNINMLFQYINIPADHRLLVIVWAAECLRPNTPFPVLELIGEAGAAKSTTQQILRRVIDPNASELRGAPKSVEDVFIGAGLTHVLSLENISHLAAPMQDALCVLATGGGHAKRKLYTDADESVIQVKRPVVLNGISVSVTAQDLVDRAVTVDLPLIAERVEKDVLLERFDRDHAAILGGLLDVFAAALARLPRVDLPADQRPRLIEFAKLGVAIAEVMKKKGTVFLDQFNASRTDAVHRTLDASPAAAALVDWFDARGRREVEIVLKDLLTEVERFRPMGAESWPRSAKGFGDVLRRAGPALRQIGIEVRRLGKSVGNIKYRVAARRYSPEPSPQHPQHPQAGADLGTSGTSGTSPEPVSSEVEL